MRLTEALVLLPSLIEAAAISYTSPLQYGSVQRRDEPEPEWKMNGEDAFKGIPFRKAFQITKMPTKSGIDGAQRLKFIYGPFTIRGVGDTKPVPGSSPSMDSKGGTAFNFQLDQDFPRDVTMLLSESDLLMKDLRPATLDDKIYNHHNAFMQVVLKQEPLYKCANTSHKAKLPDPVNLFAGTATEKINFNFTSGDPNTIKTGFHIPKNAILQNMVDLVNIGPTREFFTVNELEFIPGFPKDFTDTKQLLLNPDICGGVDGGALHPPVGQTKFDVSSNGIIMDADGWFVRTRGHMHDGGVDITLEVNDKLECRSSAEYGGPGFEYKDESGKLIQTIKEASQCTQPFRVKKGDRLKMTAHFDLDKHASRPMGGGSSEGHSMKMFLDGGDAEQMALMFVYFAKDKK